MNQHSRENTSVYLTGTALKLGSEQSEQSKILRFNKERISSLKNEAKVCLLEEIIGLYNMSGVSIDVMSTIAKYKSNINLEKISRTLFGNFKGIHGVGYRLQKLQIVVKDAQQPYTDEELSKLRDALYRLNVFDYEIVLMSLKKYLTSGDEIFVGEKSGSFGCFAKMEDDTEGMLGLLSKHVAIKSKGEIHANDGSGKRNVGHIIEETLHEGGPDIAAAKLSLSISQCDTRFKSASGQPLRSESGHDLMIEQLLGRKVHMWGAKSKPGNGIITIPKYICEGMDHSLIQVEDIVDGEGTVGNRFAQPGDSGAIACTDDPGQKFVSPISMNIGCLNYEVVEKDNKKRVKKQRGKYLTVPLQSGVQEISKKMGKQIKLC